MSCHINTIYDENKQLDKKNHTLTVYQRGTARVIGLAHLPCQKSPLLSALCQLVCHQQNLM